MWILFVFIFNFLLALVNYIDEYLTANNALPAATDLHTKIGGLLLVSTLLTGVGSIILWLIAGSVALSTHALLLALFSAVPMVIVWMGYFYLLNTYPVYQVIPLFQLSSIWLLCIELATGAHIAVPALIGIAILVVGAYLLDAGTLKWQIPTKMLIYMVPVSLSWALTLFMVKLASSQASDLFAVTFGSLLEW